MPKNITKSSFFTNLTTLPGGCKKLTFGKSATNFQYNGQPYTPRRLAYLLQSDKPLSSLDIVRQKKSCTIPQCCNIDHLYTVKKSQLSPSDEAAAISQIRQQLRRY